nr:sigma 54-interacting transcriptional regulator [Cricetibacter osteomyelitidis]
MDLHRFSANQSHVFDDVVAKSPKMQMLLEKAKKFALLDAPLLIQGETGTGKELLAKACHHLSFRSENKFIAVNCAGLPAENAESEMFGYYDGEKKSTGFFEYADGGTVLLDGISELSLALQAKLLRFLNDGTFRRVGEEQENYANVRVICTTQGLLQDYVELGKIREDLFHRLNVLALTIPPLRERREDIPDLVDLFVNQICQQLRISRPHFSAPFLQYLINYPWSGNVRELYNALYRACSLAEHGELSIEGLNLLDKELTILNIEQFGDETLDDIMHQFEAAVLRKFFEQYPSTRKLATRLGVSHTAIANKLRQYGISK